MEEEEDVKLMREIGSEWWIALQEQYDEEAEFEA
jgi:hypothetical protein